MLSGKTAVVTGASRGIGRAIAEKLAAEGAFVVINYNGSKEAAETVLAGIRAAGGDGCVMQCNVSDFAACEVWMKEILALYGKIDILVNNAGLIRREDAISFSERDWDDVMNLNIKSVFFMSQAAAKHFIAQGNGGKIINIASMLSFQGGIRVPSYTASKSAVMGVTRLLANEWAQHNINVNAIAPGYMATNNTQQLRADEERSAAILERIPAGRWGLPSDLMGPVVFLASPASDYINGYTVAVDGGWLAR
mgnify:CR=1 FL=1